MTEETEVATPKRVTVDDRPIVAPTIDGSGQHEGIAGDGETPESVGTGANGARRRRRRGGRGRGRGGASRPTGAGADSPETTSGATDTTDVGGTDEVTEPKPTRPRRPAQRRRPASPAATTGPGSGAGNAAVASDAGTDTAADATRDDVASDDAAGPDPTGSSPRRRRRGGRGRGGKPSTAAGTATDASDPDAPPLDATPETQRDDATPDAPASGTAPARRRRRGGTGRAKSDATSAPSEAPAAAPTPRTPAPRRGRKTTSIEDQVASGGPTRGLRSTRSRTGREGGRRRREPLIVPPRVTDKLMVITEHGERDQIAVLEENLLVQHYVTRTGATSMVGNVYLGRVQNVLPGMEAAFVDIGRGRNGVLYAGEVNYRPEDLEGPAPRIEHVLKPGQAVVVQVTKDPMGGKGARLTAQISMPGRFLVLAPNQALSGISRRLSEDERRRLKAVLRKIKPAEHGIIVRTAAEGASEDALTSDLERLIREWDAIQRLTKKVKALEVLYEEPELTVRVVRDLFTDEEFRALVTDSPRVYDKIMAYVRDIAPDLEPKISLHTGKLPAFEQYRIVEQIHKALDKKVWLPSGGYLFIERTEAMTIIDVNTGKSVGKTNLEETVVNTNLEAASEVARQLRLRDIGGIIVIDFIDMLLEQNKKKVEDTMKEALAVDKTRSQVFEIGPLGLMQVTRKRVSSGLVESFSETCPTCEGRGIIINYDP
jgi:ribonuclease E